MISEVTSLFAGPQQSVRGAVWVWKSCKPLRELTGGWVRRGRHKAQMHCRWDRGKKNQGFLITRKISFLFHIDSTEFSIWSPRRVFRRYSMEMVGLKFSQYIFWSFASLLVCCLLTHSFWSFRQTRIKTCRGYMTLLVQCRDQQTFPVQNLKVNIFIFVGYSVCVTTTRLCHCSTKGPYTTRKWMGATMSLRSFIQKKQVTGPSLVQGPKFANPWPYM